MYAPSLERIYGNRLVHLRESFHTILLALDNIQTLLDMPCPEEDDIESKFAMLLGSTYRHFDKEVAYMYRIDYKCTECHIDKHSKFTTMVEMFKINFEGNTREENLKAFRDLQRWVSVHLLMDDAYFVQVATDKVSNSCDKC
jgi:hemerythrin-like metal-binding protein